LQKQSKLVGSRLKFASLKRLRRRIEIRLLTDGKLRLRGGGLSVAGSDKAAPVDGSTPPSVVPSPNAAISQPSSSSQRRNSRSPIRLVPSRTTLSMRNSNSSVFEVSR
jgi:hypothetical protein